MNEATITFTLKILSPLDNARVSLNTCITILKLTIDSNRRICYLASDDSVNVMEGPIAVYKFVKFSQFFGRWVQLSLSMRSNYIINTATANPYIFNPLLNANWKNLYAFYVNEIPVIPFREFNFDTMIHKTALYFNTLEIGNDFWAYLSELNVYKGYISNPFISPTNTLLKESLVKNYSFKTTYKNAKLNLIPSDIAIYGSYCIRDDIIDMTQYKVSLTTLQNYNLAFGLNLNCIADYSALDDGKRCDGTSFIDTAVLYKNNQINCLSCSTSCQASCAFKGNNGCSSNLSNFQRIYLKYSNYNISDQPAMQIADINGNYVFTGVPETKRVSMVDVSHYTLNLDKIKVATGQKYSMEFWYNLQLYGQSDFIKANGVNSNAQFPILFNSHEFIWDNHMLVRIENINNEINVSCLPIFKKADKTNNALYQNAMDEYNKNKQTVKQSDLLYRGSKWVYVSCSVNIPEKSYVFNSKPFILNILSNNGVTSVTDQANNPYNFLNDIKSGTITSTTLSVAPGDGAKSNYGMLFVQELRLWSDSNLKRFSTNCRYLYFEIDFIFLFFKFKFNFIFNFLFKKNKIFLQNFFN